MEFCCCSSSDSKVGGKNEAHVLSSADRHFKGHDATVLLDSTYMRSRSRIPKIPSLPLRRPAIVWLTRRHQTGSLRYLLCALLTVASLRHVSSYSKLFTSTNSSMNGNFTEPIFVINFDMAAVICQSGSNVRNLRVHDISALCDGKLDCVQGVGINDENFPFCESGCEAECSGRGACLRDGQHAKCFYNTEHREDNTGCSDQSCHWLAQCEKNLFGQPECKCFDGFTGNGHTCIDLDECVSGLAKCPTHATCINLPGSYACSCGRGYRLRGTHPFTMCEDIDECATSSHNCEPYEKCQNTEGSYVCVRNCGAGYALSSNGNRCEDVDECAASHLVGVPICDARAKCVNKLGGFECRCEDGFREDGKTCALVADCTVNENVCDRRAECVPLLKTCVCREGYTGDGAHCQDINECERSENACDIGRRCVNIDGGFLCCNAAEDPVTCRQREGAFCGGGCGQNAICYEDSCRCISGYVGDPKIQCDDIDECAQDVCSGVSERCVNLAGGHICCAMDSESAECQGGHIKSSGNSEDTEMVFSADEHPSKVAAGGAFNENSVLAAGGAVTKAQAQAEAAVKKGSKQFNPINFSNATTAAASGKNQSKLEVLHRNVLSGGYVLLTRHKSPSNTFDKQVDFMESQKCDLRTRVSTCPENALCVDGLCKCHAGFGWNIATKLCEDIDECKDDIQPCTPSRFCVNTIGGYRCCSISGGKPSNIEGIDVNSNLVNCSGINIVAQNFRTVNALRDSVRDLISLVDHDRGENRESSGDGIKNINFPLEELRNESIIIDDTMSSSEELNLPSRAPRSGQFTTVTYGEWHNFTGGQVIIRRGSTGLPKIEFRPVEFGTKKTEVPEEVDSTVNTRTIAPSIENKPEPKIIWSDGDEPENEETLPSASTSYVTDTWDGISIASADSNNLHHTFSTISLTTNEPADVPTAATYFLAQSKNKLSTLLPTLNTKTGTSVPDTVTTKVNDFSKTIPLDDIGLEIVGHAKNISTESVHDLRTKSSKITATTDVLSTTQEVIKTDETPEENANPIITSTSRTVIKTKFSPDSDRISTITISKPSIFAKVTEIPLSTLSSHLSTDFDESNIGLEISFLPSRKQSTGTTTTESDEDTARVIDKSHKGELATITVDSSAIFNNVTENIRSKIKDHMTTTPNVSATAAINFSKTSQSLNSYSTVTSTTPVTTEKEVIFNTTDAPLRFVTNNPYVKEDQTTENIQQVTLGSDTMITTLMAPITEVSATGTTAFIDALNITKAEFSTQSLSITSLTTEKSSEIEDNLVQNKFNGVTKNDVFKSAKENITLRFDEVTTNIPASQVSVQKTTLNSTLTEVEAITLTPSLDSNYLFMSTPIVKSSQSSMTDKLSIIEIVQTSPTTSSKVSKSQTLEENKNLSVTHTTLSSRASNVITSSSTKEITKGLSERQNETVRINSAAEATTYSASTKTPTQSFTPDNLITDVISSNKLGSTNEVIGINIAAESTTAASYFTSTETPTASFLPDNLITDVTTSNAPGNTNEVIGINRVTDSTTSYSTSPKTLTELFTSDTLITDVTTSNAPIDKHFPNEIELTSTGSTKSTSTKVINLPTTKERLIKLTTDSSKTSAVTNNLINISRKTGPEILQPVISATTESRNKYGKTVEYERTTIRAGVEISNMNIQKTHKTGENYTGNKYQYSTESTSSALNIATTRDMLSAAISTNSTAEKGFKITTPTITTEVLNKRANGSDVTDYLKVIISSTPKKNELLSTKAPAMLSIEKFNSSSDSFLTTSTFNSITNQEENDQTTTAQSQKITTSVIEVTKSNTVNSIVTSAKKEELVTSPSVKSTTTSLKHTEKTQNIDLKYNISATTQATTEDVGLEISGKNIRKENVEVSTNFTSKGSKTFSGITSSPKFTGIELFNNNLQSSTNTNKSEYSTTAQPTTTTDDVELEMIGSVIKHVEIPTNSTMRPFSKITTSREFVSIENADIASSSLSAITSPTTSLTPMTKSKYDTTEQPKTTAEGVKQEISGNNVMRKVSNFPNFTKKEIKTFRTSTAIKSVDNETNDLPTSIANTMTNQKLLTTTHPSDINSTFISLTHKTTLITNKGELNNHNTSTTSTSMTPLIDIWTTTTDYTEVQSRLNAITGDKSSNEVGLEIGPNSKETELLDVGLEIRGGLKGKSIVKPGNKTTGGELIIKGTGSSVTNKTIIETVGSKHTTNNARLEINGNGSSIKNAFISTVVPTPVIEGVGLEISGKDINNKNKQVTSNVKITSTTEASKSTTEGVGLEISRKDVVKAEKEGKKSTANVSSTTKPPTEITIEGVGLEINGREAIKKEKITTKSDVETSTTEAPTEITNEGVGLEINGMNIIGQTKFSSTAAVTEALPSAISTTTTTAKPESIVEETTEENVKSGSEIHGGRKISSTQFPTVVENTATVTKINVVESTTTTSLDLRNTISSVSLTNSATTVAATAPRLSSTTVVETVPTSTSTIVVATVSTLSSTTVFETASKSTITSVAETVSLSSNMAVAETSSNINAVPTMNVTENTATEISSKTSENMKAIEIFTIIVPTALNSSPLSPVENSTSAAMTKNVLTTESFTIHVPIINTIKSSTEVKTPETTTSTAEFMASSTTTVSAPKPPSVIIDRGEKATEEGNGEDLLTKTTVASATVLDGLPSHNTTIENITTSTVSSTAAVSSSATIVIPVYKTDKKTGGCESSNECGMDAYCDPQTGLCHCNNGFSGQPPGVTCTDVDECAKKSINCHPTAQCQNAIGSVMCVCPPGYRKNADGSCKDIDECAEQGAVALCAKSATCENLSGFYACRCNAGFTGDGYKCVETGKRACTPAEWTASDCGRNHLCHVDAHGRIDCETCKRGFHIVNGVCSDIDECEEPAGSVFAHKCHADARCVNLDGGYTCQCAPGYAGDGFYCEDIDECSAPMASSSQVSAISGVDLSLNETDLSTNGEPKENGESTLEVNNSSLRIELTSNSNMQVQRCHPKAECHNTPGAFECRCINGWLGDGIANCAPEHGWPQSTCDVNTGRCGGLRNVSSVCYAGPTNDSGLSRVICECRDGFRYNPIDGGCIDVDECTERRDVCERVSGAVCRNLEGSYICECTVGYEGANGNCRDVDECARGTADCHANAYCVNSPGGFSCHCAHGYRGDGVNCLPITMPEVSGQTTVKTPNDGNVAETKASECPDDWLASCRALNKTCHIDEEEVAQCSSCLFGYQPMNGRCRQIDELGNCADPSKNNCNVNADCIDVNPGRHFCTCKEGFIGDGLRCDDVNECTIPGLCDPHASCRNANGTFECTCQPGYQGNGIQCKEAPPTPIQEYTGATTTVVTTTANCLQNPTVCHPNAFCDWDGVCQCGLGFKGDGMYYCNKASLNTIKVSPTTNPTTTTSTLALSYPRCGTAGEPSDGRDISGYVEIPIDSGAKCHALATCDFSRGDANGGICVCNPGYEGDGYTTCTPTWKDCRVHSSICHYYAKCDNQTGDCLCGEGFLGDGINSCLPDSWDCKSRGPALCNVQATCVNRRCTCRPGFIGDGITCMPVQLPQGAGANCIACHCHARCNTETRRCECIEGYIGNGLLCVPDPVNCTHYPALCHPAAKCNNATGVCQCQSGYSGDGRTCRRVLTCLTNAGLCGTNAHCLPSGSCRCDDGYFGDGHSCSPAVTTTTTTTIPTTTMVITVAATKMTPTTITATTTMPTIQPVGDLGVECLAIGIRVHITNKKGLPYGAKIFVQGQKTDPYCSKTFPAFNDRTDGDSYFDISSAHCNTQVEANNTVTVTVILQKHATLQTAEAVAYRLNCFYPIQPTTAATQFNITGNAAETLPIASAGPPPTCALTVTNAKNDAPVSAATVGEVLKLSLSVEPRQLYAVLPRNCYAINTASGERYALTDAAGCAIGTVIFPEWSRVHTYLAQAFFRTFKWPDTSSIRFECDCSACVGICPTVNCQRRRDVAAHYHKRMRLRFTRQNADASDDELSDALKAQNSWLAKFARRGARLALSSSVEVNADAKQTGLDKFMLTDKSVERHALGVSTIPWLALAYGCLIVATAFFAFCCLCMDGTGIGRQRVLKAGKFGGWRDAVTPSSERSFAALTASTSAFNTVSEGNNRS